MLTTAALAAAPTLAAPAHAAPPANDAIAGAVVTTTAPSTVSFDTTEATADPTDGPCVGDKSVWFRFDATETRSVRMTTAGSDYDTRLAIFSGPRNQRSLVDCDDNSGPGRTSAEQLWVRAGERYWVAVSSCCEPHPGGAAVLTIGRVATPRADIVVEGARSGEISGRLYVDGTITCTTHSSVYLYAEVSQRVGDGVARGTGSRRLEQCSEEPRAWTVRVDSATGWAFAPGPVFVVMRGWIWDGITYARVRETTATPVATNDPAARLAR